MNAAAPARAIERHPSPTASAWLALRRENINASEIGIVCGAAGYGSPAELYAEKKGLRPPLIDNGTLKRGRWGEAAVFEALADERPEWDVRRAKVYLRDPALRIGATPDGFAIAPDRDGFGVVQTKMVSRSVFRAKWLVDPGRVDRRGRGEAAARLRAANADRRTLGRLSLGRARGGDQWRIRLGFSAVRRARATPRPRRASSRVSPPSGATGSTPA